MKPANGGVILALGILSLVSCGCLTGLPAWLMGNTALREIESGRADPNDRNLVQIGRILGIVGTILSAGGLCAFVLWLLLFGGMIALSSGGL